MNKLTKAISLGMAVAMIATSLPNLAVADDDDDDDDRRRGHYAREYRDDHRRHHRAERRHWKERHYKYHRKERHRHRRAEKRHHKKVVVHKHHERRVVVHKHKHKYKNSYDPWPLLAVVGITAAYLHANAARPEPVVRYVERQPTPPPPPQSVAAAQPAPQGPASTCLMTREYQTQIVVNGELVNGYGHACLQPDGSWYRGPAVVGGY